MSFPAAPHHMPGLAHALAAPAAPSTGTLSFGQIGQMRRVPAAVMSVGQVVLNTAVTGALAARKASPASRLRPDGKPMVWHAPLVQWQDVQRCKTALGGVSCWGTNIMDVREMVLAADNTSATAAGCLSGAVGAVAIRPENWNETVATCPASQFLVVVAAPDTGKPTTVPLSMLLQHLGQYFPQRGLPADMDLSAASDNDGVQVGVKGVVLEPGSRFVGTGDTYGGTDTLYLYCNAQGTTVGVPCGGKTSFFAVVGTVSTGFKLRTFVADATNIRVEDLARQVESKEDADAALAAGKAVAAAVGPSWLPPSINTFALVQVPLVPLAARGRGGGGGGGYYGGGSFGGVMAGCAAPASFAQYDDDMLESGGMCFGAADDDEEDDGEYTGSRGCDSRSASPPAPRGGRSFTKSSVARVSVDSTDLGPAPSLAEFATRKRDPKTPLRIELGRYVTVPASASTDEVQHAVLQLTSYLETLLFEGLDAPKTLAQMDLPLLPGHVAPAAPRVETAPEPAAPAPAPVPAGPPAPVPDTLLTITVQRHRVFNDVLNCAYAAELAETIPKTLVPEAVTRLRLATDAVARVRAMSDDATAMETRTGVFTVRTVITV